MNELLASGMNKEEMLQKAGDYLFKLEEEHPEHFLIGAHKRKRRNLHEFAEMSVGVIMLKLLNRG